jgi:hypothetical protein
MALPGHAAAQVKVRVGEVATIAYAAVFGRLGLALELGWLPLLIMLATELVPGVIESLTPAPADAAAPSFSITDVVQIVAGLLCLNAFAVRWYHALLFSNGRTLSRRLFVGAWARFIGYTLLFSLLTAGPTVAILVSGAPSAPDDPTRIVAGALAVLNIAISLGVLRLSLIWPAAAQGTPMGWREAWRQMRGNTWRLLAAGLVVYTPIFVTVLFVLGIILVAARVEPEQLSHPTLGLVLLEGVVDNVLPFIFVALGAAVLVEFHRRIVRNAPADRSGDQ